MRAIPNGPGVCNYCGTRPRARRTGSRTLRYRSRCWKCLGTLGVQARRRAGPRTRSVCTLCGFVAADPVQLDADHINGNHADNRPENLQVICANCHRLKTKRRREYMRPEMRIVA